MRQLLILLLISSLSIFTTISCTSSNDAADGEEIADAEGVEDGSELDNIDDAELDGEEVAEGDAAEGDEFAEEGASEEDALLDEGGEEVAGEGDAAEDSGTEETADAGQSDFAEDGSTAGTEDTAVADDTTAIDDSSTTNTDSGTVTDISGGETSEPLTDDSDAAAPGFAETDTSTTSSFAEPTEDIAKTWVPVKKVASTPFNKGGQLLNTVYIVRPGDTLESVSQKIFGADKSSDILAANPHLSRSFTTGDKLYYNSPNRSGDSAQMLTYYEDVGMQPQTYVSQDGENIRTLGKTLLGDSASWKELWATNASIDSKDELPAGTEIRYFPEGGAPAMPPVAQNTMPPVEPPPVEQPAVNDIPPPPPPSDMAGAGTMEPPPPPPPVEPPPPPPPVAMEPPPPPPEAKVAKKEAGQGMNMKLILAACLLIGGGLAIVILQKSKSKKINIGETQI